MKAELVHEPPKLKVWSAGPHCLFKPGIERVQACTRYHACIRWHFAFALRCHSNATGALSANPPNTAQLGGITYQSLKLHLGPCKIWPDWQRGGGGIQKPQIFTFHQINVFCLLPIPIPPLSFLFPPVPFLSPLLPSHSLPSPSFPSPFLPSYSFTSPPVHLSLPLSFPSLAFHPFAPSHHLPQNLEKKSNQLTNCWCARSHVTLHIVYGVTSA